MKTNTTPSKGFPFPADFCGLNGLVEDLEDVTWEMEDSATWSALDDIEEVVRELRRLQDGLRQLRHDRAGKGEQEIDSFLDLLRGIKAGEGQ